MIFLSFVIAASSAPVASRIAVYEAFPRAFQVDGDLAEWTDSPSLSIGPEDQLAGSVKLTTPQDFSVTAWIAISQQGIAVAGKVTDDKVRFPEGAKVVNADHAELWLAFPAAPMPPLAFANQFGETEVQTPEACEQTERPDDCKTWLAVQQRRRKSLERLFMRQYLITPQGLTESWSTIAHDAAPPEPPQTTCCSKSTAIVKAVPGGWVFEARIDAADFPATSQVPLRDVALLLDLADADDQIDKLESFVSTQPKRKLGRPFTFNTVTLRTPLVWESDPPIIRRLAAEDPLFFFPGATSAYFFVNPAVGYQYTPEQPSPAVATLQFDPKPVAQVGEVKIYREPDFQGLALWSLRGAEIVDTIAAEGVITQQVKRGDALHLVLEAQGTATRLGTGACGACPRSTLQIVAIDAAGNFKDALHESVIESDDATDVKIVREKDRVGFSGQDAKGKTWKRLWRYDARKKTYVR